MHEGTAEERQTRQEPERRSSGSSQGSNMNHPPQRQHSQNYHYNHRNGQYNNNNNYQGHHYHQYPNHYNHNYNSGPHYYNNNNQPAPRGNHHRGSPNMGGGVQHYSPGHPPFRQDYHTPLNNFNGSEISRHLSQNWTSVYDAMNNPHTPTDQRPIVAQVTPATTATSSPWGATKHGCIANGQSLLSVLRASAATTTPTTTST